MKKRKLLGMLCIGILILSMMGCGSKGDTNEKKDTNGTTNTSNDKVENNDDKATDSTDSAEQIKLRMAWWGSQTRHDRTVAVIELYESLNPGIDIEYEFYDFEGYFNKLNALVASDEVWDIYQLGSNFTTYESKIVLLDEYVADGTIDVSNISESFINTTKDANGKLVGLSNGINTYGIAYDPQMFIDAGLEEPTENWTWDDWYTACITISEKLGIYGSSKFEDWICGVSMNVPQHGNYTLYTNTLDGLGFTDYTMLIDYMQKRADLVAAGAYPDAGALAEITDIENDFVVTGEAAMTWVATNQFETLATAAGKELKLVNPPRISADGKLGLTVNSSQMLSVSTDSDYPAEAAKFISWFQNSVEANAILQGERGIPINMEVRESLSTHLTDDMKNVYAYVDTISALNEGEAVNAVPAVSAEIQEQYVYQLDKVIYGEKTADEAAKAFYEFALSKFE